MAQVILSRVGAALGARVVPAFSALGRTLGRAAGAFVGARIDSALFDAPRRVEGARLTDVHVQTSEEGASLPVAFGRVRIAGQVIWAARYRERVDTRTTGGGKDRQPRTETTTYSYSLSFAVGLCAGEIARVERVWANGRPFDLSAVSHRVHRGGEEQPVDPLIEAIEGADDAPAYRGVAYVVFEDLPLEDFGNAMPQLCFEVVRAPAASGPRLESMARAVCLIPASGEFVYATEPVRRVVAAGEETAENVHALQDRANVMVSLDQLGADLPGVAAVSLAVGWFGDDLRCAACTIKPGVEIAAKATRPLSWRAGGLDRAAARLVSTVDGAPAYGGTPDDASVLQVIAALKARAIAVTLNPFLFMDIPPTNALPDPYGGLAQAAYPWRGRITCDPSPGAAGSVDKTATAGSQIAAFFGTVNGGDFTFADGVVTCVAPDWRYRQFILHYAHLAAQAGGVATFVIGSELRGVTTVRSDASTFPAVAQLRALAAEVRAVVGPDTAIVYAADWSEYGGHRPQDGSGDVFFHLDPLWADPEIAAVGIDWYAPLADWRDGPDHLDAALSRDGRDLAYLTARIEGGEGFDWYYASDADRAAQVRTSITDGAYAKPWVFRAKDLRRFWSEPHHDRPGGVENGAPTAWIPASKPIWFMELGAPAIDKGANAPNLFLDPKSAENAAPPFSSGARDDLIQRRTLEAYLAHWADDSAANPVSPLTGARMVDAARIFLWTWDARPFPQFPARGDVWSDGEAWRRGHWLNGRAGAATLADVVRELCVRAGVTDADVSGLSGVVTGYVVDAPTTLDAALTPLMGIYRFTVHERAGALTFRHLDDAPVAPLTEADVVTPAPERAFVRADVAALPIEARVRFIDGENDHRVGSASARQRDFAAKDVISADAPLVLDPEQARALCEAILRDGLAARDTAVIDVSPARLDLEPGDVVDATAFGGPGRMRIARIEDAAARRLVLVGDAGQARPAPAAATISAGPPLPVAGRPDLVVLDLPPLPGAESEERPRAAVFARPWRGPVEVFAGAARAGVTRRGVARAPAGAGTLAWDLYPGPVGRWDEGNVTRLHLPGVTAASVDALALFAGANAFAVAQPGGGWEIVQARGVTLVGPDTYEVRELLRGQQGTETDAVARAGARVVWLDDALAPLDMAAHERGATLLAVAPPLGRLASDADAAVAGFAYEDVWSRPFSPAQVRGRREPSGDVQMSWIRRTRLGGDAWQGEVPLGEEVEAYRVEIRDGAVLRRVFESAAPSVLYAAADQMADFGALPATLAVRVAQVSSRHGPGRGRDSILQL
ncbi:MAG: glycoside hydrolase/phage tail family protein [Hyphomonadaceae bacterium]|nr:glycoside hydrolase/phage tail family protein [Hyphomonadaceae bacterium]